MENFGALAQKISDLEQKRSDFSFFFNLFNFGTSSSLAYKKIKA